MASLVKGESHEQLALFLYVSRFSNVGGWLREPKTSKVPSP
jgi:hypothetical protein